MKLSHGLIVSCQAAEGETLFGLDLMKYMALCAKNGGAVGIRALAEEIPSIKSMVDLPVIGLVKRKYEGSPIYITPTKREVDAVLATGAEVIALDATGRKRPNGETLKGLIAYIRSAAPNVEIMADADTYEAAMTADALGVDYVGTTMRGYTDATAGIAIPDCDLLRKLASSLRHAKLIAEGGIWERDGLKEVLSAKPYAVVIGTAITRPTDITKRFVKVFEDGDK